jgi:Spy/CpxP family protein refolding chaperone
MRWLGSVLVVLVVAGAAAPLVAAAQSRRPHQWWQSEEVTALLDLSEEQAANLDRIYRKTLPKMHESYDRLKAEERTLSQMIANMQVEEIDITRQIDRVEAARSELSKTRTLMVFRMYRVMDPTQRSALKEWMDLKPDNERSGRSRSRCG